MLIDAPEGEHKVRINITLDEFQQLLFDAEESSSKMGFVFDWTCLINYIIAHYQGHFRAETFYVDVPMRRM